MNPFGLMRRAHQTLYQTASSNKQMEWIKIVEIRMRMCAFGARVSSKWLISAAFFGFFLLFCLVYYLDSIATRILCRYNRPRRISILAIYFEFRWNDRPTVVRPAIPIPANRIFGHCAMVCRRANCCVFDGVNGQVPACPTMNFATISSDHQPN